MNLNLQNAPKTFLQMVLRQRTVILASIAAGAVLSMIGFKYVPKRFKVQAVVGIQTQYFQNPLVRDFLPETFDGLELRSQREAVIRRALSHEYVADLAKRHKLLGPDKEGEISSFDLELLAKRFEIVPTGPTSFLIGFFSNDAELGYNVIQEFIERVRTVMNNERRATLLRLHDAIRERLEALSYGKQLGSPGAIASRPDLLKQEIDRVEEEIRILRSSYSDRHPRVTALAKRLADLKKWSKLHPEESGNAPTVASFSGAKVDPASKDLFQDLLKKYHYLEVVIYLDQQNQDAYLTVLQEPFVPKAPVWPKRPIFLVWGVALGFLIGAGIALGSEILRARQSARPIAETLAQKAGLTGI